MNKKMALWFALEVFAWILVSFSIPSSAPWYTYFAVAAYGLFSYIEGHSKAFD